jgi:hypothetical protein
VGEPFVDVPMGFSEKNSENLFGVKGLQKHFISSPMAFALGCAPAVMEGKKIDAGNVNPLVLDQPK